MHLFCVTLHEYAGNSVTYYCCLFPCECWIGCTTASIDLPWNKHLTIRCNEAIVKNWVRPTLLAQFELLRLETRRSHECPLIANRKSDS